MKQIWLQAAEYVNAPDWLDRKSWHDTIWLLVPLVAILVTAPVWFFRLADIDMTSITWILFAYSLLREVGNFYAKKANDPKLLLRVAFLSDVLGVCTLGVLWHFSQTVRDPLFLLVMIVPIVAGALIYPSAVTYTFTGISIGAVLVVAWFDIPQFRLMFLEASFLPGWLAAKLSAAGLIHSGVESNDFSAANAVAILIAFCFSFVLIACILDGMRRYFMGALESRSAELAFVSAERRPNFCIDRANYAVTEANEAFWQYTLAERPQADNAQLQPKQGLFESIRFEEEEELQALIAGHGGTLICHYRIGPEERMGRVHVEIVSGGRQCRLTIEDLSAETYLRLTLDVLHQAVILLGSNDIVLYFNGAASRLFPALADGVEAAAVLQGENLGSPWWELGNSAQHDRNVRLNGRIYHSTCTAAQLPGQELPISVLSLSEVQ